MSSSALAAHWTGHLPGARERESLVGLRRRVESAEQDVAEESALYGPTRDDVEQLEQTVARLAAVALGLDEDGR